MIDCRSYGRIRIRMIAVHIKCVRGMTKEEIASMLLQCTS